MNTVYMVECVYNDDGMKTSYISATFNEANEAKVYAEKMNSEFTKAKFYVLPINSNVVE